MVLEARKREGQSGSFENFKKQGKSRQGNIGIEPSELNQVQMVRVFVTITQQLTLAQVTRKFCTQKGFSDHLAVKHENFTGTVCIFVNGGGGGGTTPQVFLWIHLVASNRFRIFRVSPSFPQTRASLFPYK